MNRAKTELRRLNVMNRDGFVRVVGPVFEHSPWIAERTWNQHPFASIEQLHQKLVQTMQAANEEEKLGLIRAHPDLVGKMADAGNLTPESRSEQAAAGLDRLSPDEREAFRAYNEMYRDQFGFPFIICARENKKDAILSAFPRRLKNSREKEIAAALEEIAKIARLRLVDSVQED